MKRWRSIRRKIAKNSNRKGIYSHSIWNNFRKPGIYLMVTVILFITKVGILYTYGGEFGGFDIDIGADEGIFDNWEEAEGNQETTEPEQKENGSSNGNESNNNSNNDSANGGISSNEIENDDNNDSHNSGSSNDNNSGNNNGNNSSNSNAGAGLSKTENGDNTGDKEGWEKPQAAGSERRPKENKKENSVTAASPANKNAENKKTNINADNIDNGTEAKSNTTKKTPRVEKNRAKSKEEKSEDTAADENISESRITARETKNTDRKKENRAKAKITECSKKENTSEYLKLTGAGTVFTAVGMAKTSHGLGFYNRNDENREKNENTDKNTDKNNNINDDENSTIRFVHEETVPVNEYPEIQVIRTTGEQDVTILSLNLNGDEIFWHQEGDTLIFDQPITAKENTVKVIAVIDGRRIVHMPIWEF